jgi:predicted Zn-dependent protease
VKPLLGRTRALEWAECAIQAALAAGADQAEAVLLTADSQVTRYARDRIHQQVAERNAELRVRAVCKTRQAVVAGNQATEQACRELGERAASRAKLSPEDPLFPGLPEPSPMPYVDQTTFYDSTAGLDGTERARVVKGILALAGQVGAEAYGLVTNGLSELAVVNSQGITAYQAFTDAWLSVIARQKDGGQEKPLSGYAAAGHRDWSELDANAVAARALGKISPLPLRRLPPGRYPVLLEEDAVAELLDFLAADALNGLTYLEGRSPYSGRLGQKAYPACITLRDDPTDQRGANTSFDFEGVTKAPLTLIREGYLEQVAWDSATAARAIETSTGHALPAPNAHGPVPLNLALRPGPASRADLLRELDHGLLVTRLHYVNTVQPSTTLLTGMTRDGTFLVEHGEVVAAVQDLRWVHSVDEVLARTAAVGRDLRLVSWGPGYGMRFLNGSLVAPLVTDGFQITGSADG